VSAQNTGAEKERRWPDFRPEWVLFEDAELIFVEKPCGVSTQAADPTDPDDLVLRLGRYRESRGEPAYLGVHQRLDKDTSGVMVFAKERSVNAHLAKVFEGREAKKVYLACVVGFRGEGGPMDDVLDGKKARAVVKVKARKGQRALLEITLLTGRMHQIRAQLQKRRSPVAGDVLYDGPPAPRLMLHAASLAFPKPGGGNYHVSSRVPSEFTDWVDGASDMDVYDNDTRLRPALERAMERRFGLGRSTHTTAFRLVNEEGDGLPRLAVDVYDEWVVAQLYGTDGPWAKKETRDRVLDALLGLGFRGVYLKVRPKQANELVDTRREDLAPKLPVRGEAAPDAFVVHELGVPYTVKLGDGLSTGIFLDQRKNRRLVRDLSHGARVLNLFSYTCPFTVAAAVGGAELSVSVDAAPISLEWGMKNVVGAVGETERKKHTFIAMDVFSYLAREEKRGTTFDLVIVDPPSYSNTKRHRFSAASDYPELLASAMRLTAPGGKIIACCNHRGISKAKFRKFAFDAARLAGREVAQAKDLPECPDYPVAAGADPNMKSVLISLSR
jgi:23S rRNA (cytosine1962-C5)-methyltransferase